MEKPGVKFISGLMEQRKKELYQGLPAKQVESLDKLLAETLRYAETCSFRRAIDGAVDLNHALKSLRASPFATSGFYNTAVWLMEATMGERCGCRV